MFSGSNIGINGGTFSSTIVHQTNRTSRGMDILMRWVATDAFHNSRDLHDAPKCHPGTRVAVLNDIMQWVNESESVRNDFMMWLFGPAGSGKSAIAKRIAEISLAKGQLIADFFFSRSSPTRNTTDRLISTLAYQLAVSIPDTRSYIEDAIERDPAIFNKNILTQIDTLLVKPFQSILSTQIVPSRKLIIIDGLDECNDSQAQVGILEAISCSFTQHKLPIIFLVASRPEPDIVALFDCNKPLRYKHRRLALDDTYQPDDDIRRFFSDKFEHIKRTHLLRPIIPITWPPQETLDTLVQKSSGQFIYASTVVKFVESSRHHPASRLNIILGISPPGRINPFAELDALYNHLLSSVDNIQSTLRILSLYVMAPNFASVLRFSTTPELFLSLEPGDIQLALMNLSSILMYDEGLGLVRTLHASLVDFLSDKRRSTTFYIDVASTCTDFVRRILQYVKVPDGILAGNVFLFHDMIQLFPWITKGQLRSDILNFDLDAFINALIKRRNKEHYSPTSIYSTVETFWAWEGLLYAGLEDGERKEGQDHLNKSLESRLKIYQSDWRLKLLLPLAAIDPLHSVPHDWASYCRCLDILLEMDDHNLHILDQDALNFRHGGWSKQIGKSSCCVDHDTYASAALHCMTFLSRSQKYSKRLKMGLTYAEWKATCAMTLNFLCKLLRRANTSPKLVKFIIKYDIHPAVQKLFSADHVWKVNAHILAFLSREGMPCPNWRIISAIQRRSPIITHHQLSKFEEKDGTRSDEDERKAASWHLIRQRCVDQGCCRDC